MWINDNLGETNSLQYEDSHVIKDERARTGTETD